MIPRLRANEQVGRYRFSWRQAGSFLWATAALRPRSFARDAQAAISRVHPPPEILGAEYIPAHGPCLVTCNHYTRPGFAAWWLTMAITAAVAQHRAPEADREIHWVMTAGWSFRESAWKRRVLTPFSYWAFARVARVYGFVTMPPMPPAPYEAEARAAAVLRTVRLARGLAKRGGMVGLAPEGRDIPPELQSASGLGPPPEGVGEFIALLVKAGLPVLPVGVADRRGHPRLSFGQPFVPEIPRDRAARDRVVTRQVMEAIAEQLV